MIKRLLILLILLIAVPCFGATIYIDPTASGNNDGTTPTHAFESWTGVTGGAGFVRGNTYLQKCGTTEEITLSITTAASDEETIIISAYNADGTSEIGKEVFGENCSGGLAKPIITDSDQVDKAIAISTSYIELNSIQVKLGATTIFANGDYNTYKYLRVMGGIGGLRIGTESSTDNNYVGYNYLYGDDPVPEDANDLDGIQFGGYTDYSTAEYNVVNNYCHSGIAISNRGADHNEVRYNSIYSDNDCMDQFLTANGTYNNLHHNYGFDTGVIQVYNASYNNIYSNVMDGFANNPYNRNNSRIAFHPLASGDYITYNNIFNNTIYDRRDSTGTGYQCIQLLGNIAAAGVIEDNVIANNICLNFDTTSVIFYVLDTQDKIDNSNLWNNNLAYGWTGTYVAQISNPATNNYVDITDQGSTYFNSYGSASGNLDSDPGLNNPGAAEFWPSSSASAVYQTGYDIGAPYDTLLLSTSDFTASPPLVNTDQFANDYIGAYGLVGAAKSYPFQGAAGNFKYN